MRGKGGHVRLVGGGGRDNALEGEAGRYGLRHSSRRFLADTEEEVVGDREGIC